MDRPYQTPLIHKRCEMLISKLLRTVIGLLMATAASASESSLWEIDEGQTPDGYFFERREMFIPVMNASKKWWSEEITLEVVKPGQTEYIRIDEIRPGIYSFVGYLLILHCQSPATTGPVPWCKVGAMSLTPNGWSPLKGDWSLYHMRSSDKEHVMSPEDMARWATVKEEVLQELASR
ncbi:hypothetical protein FJY93_02245 [Candidatus Kaiserbacteria bacterium]|nr:hypothetical protein [Candidatus Kaiserbacteria bacterium]